MSDVAPSANADMGVSKRSGSKYAAYVFWIMFSINLINYLDRYVFTGAANTIAKELGLGIDQVGYLATAFILVYAVGTVPLGIWADRASRKNVIAICVTVWSLATVFTALAGNFLTLFFSRMVLGIGEAGYYPAGTALLSDYFSRTRRAQIMSRWTAGSLTGLMLGFIAGGVIAGLGYGMWRLAFLFTGIPGLILAFLCFRLREPRRNQADEEAIELDPHSLVNEVDIIDPPHTAVVPKNVVHQFGRLLRIRTLVVLIVMQIFAFFSQGAAVTFLPIYLQQKDTLGLSSGLASILSGGVVVIAGIVGLLIGGYMSDALNRRHPGARVLVCGIGFLLCAPAFALSVTIHNEVAFIVAFFITAMLINVYNGPSTAATQDVVPSALRASAVAISLLLAHLLGDAFAPSLVGVLAKSFDPTHGGHFTNYLAGGDLSLAMLVTCVPTLVVAGLVGIFGARWMKSDIAAAIQTDKVSKELVN
jgi:MFS transporter, Spinster family, sphingosine-1-phosphate transporter